MLKKIVTTSILILVILILGFSLQKNNFTFETRTVFAEDRLTSQELKAELDEKGLEISAPNAVAIAEEAGGQVLAMRLRRLKDGKLGYAMMVFKNEPLTIEIIVIHGNTGKILASDEVNYYPIEVAVGKLM